MPWYNPDDPKQRNAGLVGVVLLALIYPYNSFYHSGKREEVTVLQDSLEALEQQNLRAEVLAARGGGQIEETMAEYERHVARLEELIPAGDEVAQLISDITQRARQVSVRMNDIQPETPESVGMYERQAYSISLIGEYHGVARLLADIASMPRIVRPVELNVEAYSSPDQFPQFTAPIIATFRIETYVLPQGAAGGA